MAQGELPGSFNSCARFLNSMIHSYGVLGAKKLRLNLILGASTSKSKEGQQARSLPISPNRIHSSLFLGNFRNKNPRLDKKSAKALRSLSC